MYGRCDRPLPRGSTCSDLAAVRRMLDSESGVNTLPVYSSDSVCPSCHMPFDKGKKRKIVDACGHERCFSCLIKNQPCQLCQIKDSIPPKRMLSSQTTQGSDINILNSANNSHHNRPKLKTNGHFTTYMQSRNDTVTGLPPERASPPKHISGRPTGSCIKTKATTGRATPPAGRRKFLTSPKMPRVPWGSKKKTVAAAPAPAPPADLSASSDSSVYWPVTVIRKIKSLWALDEEQENQPPPPPPADPLYTRLGLLLGEGRRTSHDCMSTGSGSDFHTTASSNTSPVSTLTGSSEAEQHLRGPTSRDTSMDSIGSLMSSSSSGIGGHASPAPPASRRHSVTTSAPGQVEELNLFAARQSSIRRSARHARLKGPLDPRVPQQEPDPLFMGRGWVFRNLEHMLLGGEPRGALITGGVGTGKTAIILQLVEHSCFGSKRDEPTYQEIYSYNEAPPSGGLTRTYSGTSLAYSVNSSPSSSSLRTLASRVVAYHFCQVDNNSTCCVAEFVHSLAAQLCQAPQLSGYRELVSSKDPQLAQALSLRQAMADPAAALTKGILEPLHSLRRLGRAPQQSCIIVIDSIHEAEYHRPDYGDTIAGFLSQHLMKFPGWLKVLVTVRSQHEQLTKLLPFHRISLDSPENNEYICRDIADYINFRVSNSPNILGKIHLSANPQEGSSGNQSRFQSHLAQTSKGCFLYVKLALDLIERGHLVVKSSSFKAVPVSLSEIYLLHFNLRFGSLRAFEKVSPLLCVCVASLYPLTALEMYYSVNASLTHTPLSWEEFGQRLKLLSSLLVRRRDDTFMFFHPSFREWLVRRDDNENAKFLVDARMGHAGIALRLSRLERPLTPEKTLELGHHILKAHIYKNTQRELLALVPRDLQALWVTHGAQSVTNTLSCEKNLYNPNIKVSRLLLLAGASPDATTEIMHRSPLLCVCAYEGLSDMVSLLLEFGANVDALNSKGQSALTMASMRGHCDIVRKLVQAGSKMNLLDDEEMSPLVYAAAKGHLNVVGYLLSYEWVTNSDTELSMEEAAQQALVAAAYHGHVNIVEFLLDMSEVKVNSMDTLRGETALTASCISGYAGVCSVLIKRGAQVATPNLGDVPALTVAVREGHWELAELLLKEGANLEQTDGYGRTPLMVAAQEGHVGVIDLLLSKGASVNRMDKEGLTALCWACVKGRVRAAQCLLDKGSDPNHADKNGKTPLDFAAFTGDCDVVQLLLERGALLEHVDLQGVRPLDRAIGFQHASVVQCFLRKGAKLGPATWAMAAGKPEIILILLTKLHEDGQLLYKKGRVQDAAYRFNYALKKFPPQAEQDTRKEAFANLRLHLLLNLSRAKRKLREPEEAELLANQALQIQPDSFEAYYTRARARREAGLSTEALSDLSEAVRLAPQNREVRRVLMRIREEIRTNNTRCSVDTINETGL